MIEVVDFILNLTNANPVLAGSLIAQFAVIKYLYEGNKKNCQMLKMLLPILIKVHNGERLLKYDKEKLGTIIYYIELNLT